MPSIINATTTNGVAISPDNSGSLQLATNNGTTAVTIDTSQNVGIGTSSPSNPLAVYRGSGVAAFIDLIGNGNTAGTSNVVIGQNADDGGYFWNRKASFLSLGASNTERMRITSSGNVGIGTSSPGKILSVRGGANVDINYFETGSGQAWSVGPVNIDSGRFNWYNDNAAANRMYLTTGGALYNSTGTYGTISDVSLKENIVDATPKLADVMQIKVRNFNLKADTEKRKVIGVIAQELEQVFPGLIEEVGERVALENGLFEEKTVKAVKYSVLTTILIKAIQEQQAMIETLKTELDTVKAELNTLKNPPVEGTE